MPFGNCQKISDAQCTVQVRWVSEIILFHCIRLNAYLMSNILHSGSQVVRVLPLHYWCSKFAFQSIYVGFVVDKPSGCGQNDLKSAWFSTSVDYAWYWRTAYRNCCICFREMSEELGIKCFLELAGSDGKSPDYRLNCSAESWAIVKRFFTCINVSSLDLGPLRLL